jgi:hypothetical protein
MSHSKSADKAWPKGRHYLTCDSIVCPCFITLDDGKEHFRG